GKPPRRRPCGSGRRVASLDLRRRAASAVPGAEVWAASEGAVEPDREPADADPRLPLWQADFALAASGIPNTRLVSWAAVRTEVGKHPASSSFWDREAIACDDPCPSPVSCAPSCSVYLRCVLAINCVAE